MTEALTVWFTATSVRAIQLGIDLYPYLDVTQVLALFLIGVLLAHIALLLADLLEGPS